jgi:5-methylcytosine-specific restriction endonuclease McrA
MKYAPCHPEKKYYAKGLCEACYARQRRTSPTIKAKQYQANKRWQAKNPEYERARGRRRWATNPAPLRAAVKCWWMKHPEKRKGYKQTWREKNPDKYFIQMRAQVKRRRALKKGATISDFTYQEWLDLLKEHNYTCYYCKEQVEPLTQDHCVPLSRGGNHTKSNIVPACGFCNNQKNNKTPEEYAQYILSNPPVHPSL